VSQEDHLKDAAFDGEGLISSSAKVGPLNKQVGKISMEKGANSRANKNADGRKKKGGVQQRVDQNLIVDKNHGRTSKGHQTRFPCP